MTPNRMLHRPWWFVATLLAAIAFATLTATAVVAQGVAPAAPATPVDPRPDTPTPDPRPDDPEFEGVAGRIVEIGERQIVVLPNDSPRKVTFRAGRGGRHTCVSGGAMCRWDVGTAAGCRSCIPVATQQRRRHDAGPMPVAVAG